MYRMQRRHSHRTDKHCSRSVQMRSERWCQRETNSAHGNTHKSLKENTLSAKEAEIIPLKTSNEEMDNHLVLELEHLIEHQKKNQIAQIQAEICLCLAMEADV